MTTKILVLLCVTALFLAMSILILAGKGDWLIAGFNLASKKEKEKVNIKRVRLVAGITLLVLIPIICIDSIFKTWLIIPICIVEIVLANTWCMKK